MDENKKTYLLIGSNNFWYSMGHNLKEETKEARLIVRGKSKTVYGNPEMFGGEDINTPETVYIYEATEINRING